MTRSTITGTAIIATIVLLLGTPGILPAQPALELPRTSQGASVMQKIGITDITIAYHRPGVKERQIWGDLVPYGEVWRVGANEKTTMTFSDAVELEGKPVAAGTYAVHMIPQAESGTFILSTNTAGWGTLYDPKDDVVRLDVTSRPSEHREWMEFSFTDLSDTGAVIALSWAGRTYPLRIAVPTPEVVLEHARREFSSAPDTTTWEMLRQAAAYAYRQDIHAADALAWIDRSLAVRKTVSGLCVRADLLSRAGRGEEASRLVDEAVALATEQDMTSYARQLRRDSRPERALELLLKFTERTDDSWMAHGALGETYEALKDPASAKKEYGIALENAPEGKEKDRLRKLLTDLEGR